MRSSLLLLCPLSGLLVGGCDGGGKLDDTSGGDTHDSAPVYDEGCITVDGAGGYAHLADAITVAEEGSTIALCEGTFAEPTEVTKGVSIIGAGPGTILEGDGTNAALTVVAANVTISGATVQGSYTGLAVTGADATISDIAFEATGGWGVTAEGATGLTISGCSFNETAGGVDVNGGSVTLTGNTFTLPTGFAIEIEGGGSAVIDDNQVDGVIADKNNYKDGYGVYVTDGSSATMSGNTIAGAGSIAVKVKDGTVDAEGEVWSESPFGLYVDGGSATVAGSTLEEQSVVGVFALGDSFSVTNTTVTTTSAASCELAYADWGPAGGDYSCGGVLLAADVSAEVADVSVSGFNNFGVFLLPYTAAETTATLSNVTVDDVGRIGMYFSGVNGTADGLTVTNLREPELAQPCTPDGYTYYIDYSASVVVASGELAVTNSTFADNAGWGISAATARVSVADSTFTNNVCSGILNVQSALEVSGSTFTGAVTTGLIWDSYGATSITTSAFSGNHATSSYTYDNGDGTSTTYTNSPAGVDLQVSSSTSFLLSDSTFSDGDQAIQSYSSEIEVVGNTFTGYEHTILYASQNTSTVFSSNTADDFGGYLMSTYYGEVEMNDNVVGSTRSYNYAYTSSTDGVLDYEYSYSSYTPLLYGYGTTSLPCDIIVDGLEAGSVYSTGINLYDCSAELSNIDFGEVGVGGSAQALYGYWYSVDPLLVIDDFQVETVTGNGVSLYGYSSGTSYIEVDGLDFSSVSGIGFYASGLESLSLTNSNLGETVSYGAQISGRTAGDSTALVDGNTVGTGAAYGIYLSSLASVEVVNNTTTERTSGMYISGSTAEIQGNAFINGTDFGMRCLATTLSLCASNDLSGNASGEHFGCDDACGM